MTTGQYAQNAKVQIYPREVPYLMLPVPATAADTGELWKNSVKRGSMGMMSINTETNRHIKHALATLNLPREEVERWPGTEFNMDTEAGRALLGSQVGRWAGYFLMQHKQKPGGSKWIEKVILFKSEKDGSLPYLLFIVAGPNVNSGQDSVTSLDKENTFAENIHIKNDEVVGNKFDRDKWFWRSGGKASARLSFKFPSSLWVTGTRGQKSGH